MEAVLGLLVNGNRVWLALRRNRPKVWSPPGGFVEEGESREQALYREVAEETGFKPESAVFLDSFSYRGLPIYLYAIEVKHPGEVKLQSPEFQEAHWFDLKNLPSPLSPSVKLLTRAVRLSKSAQLVVGSGNSKARIAFVGEAPGKEEVDAGIPFAGRSGAWLEGHVLSPLGLSRNEVWLTNAIPVFIKEPDKEDVLRWQGFLRSELNEVDPEVIVALGELAAFAVLGRPEKAGTWHEVEGRKVFIMRHPAYALRFGYPELKEHLAEIKRYLSEAVKGLPKPFSHSAGKDAWRGLLLEKVPLHKVYVEPYAGGATLFWAKEPSEEEVLSDIDPDIVALYWFLQKGSDEDFAWIRKQKWGWSPDHFEKLKNEEPQELREKAYRTKYLSLFGRRGRREILGTTPKEKQSSGQRFLKNLENYRERLKGVTILQEDAIKVMQKYDSPDTFFYLDPPWGPESFGGEKFNEGEFIEAVCNLKGKVLISYQGNLDLSKGFKRYTFTRARGGIATGSRQTLYWNYEIAKVVALSDLLDPRIVASLPDSELRAKHWRLHENWANRPGDEEILNAHIEVLREMVRRGMTHRIENLDELDRQSFKLAPELLKQLQEAVKGFQLRAVDFFAGLEDFVYLNDYISLTGSFAYPQSNREPNDIDLVIRQNFSDPKLELKLVKMVKALAPGKRVHFIYDQAGGNFYHVPLFDLVVRKKSKFAPRVIEEEEYGEKFYATSTLKGTDVEKASGYTSIMGSLDRVMPKILEYIPQHKNRVELFCGRGELVWHLDPPEGFEVLNDKDPDVIKMHHIVQNLSDEGIQRLERFKWEADAETFYKLRDEEPDDDLRWLYRRLYLARWGRKHAPVGKDSFRPSYQGEMMEVGEKLRKSQDRLRGVKLSNMDYKQAVVKYDSKDTFFFCDPPYPGRERYYAIADVDWEEFFKVLSCMKGKWMLVFSTLPGQAKEGPVAQFLKECNWVRTKWPSPLSQFGWKEDHPKYRWFYIVTNYQLEKQLSDEWKRTLAGQSWYVGWNGEDFIEKQVNRIELFNPHPPYEVAGEFYRGEDEDEVVQWVKDWLDKSQTVEIQPKFNGLRFLIHREEDKVELYTADTLAPRSEVLRSLVEEFKKIKAESFIIDAELVEYSSLPWRGKKPLPRYQMVWLSTAKDYEEVADREKNIVAFCHDLTFLNGKNFSGRGYKERFSALEDLLGDASERVVPADTWEVREISELDTALKKAFDFPGSEGAMLKASAFPYKVEGANQGVAKFKKVIEVDCLVIGYRPQTKGKPKALYWNTAEAKEHLEEQLQNNTFLFRCAVQKPDGTLMPIESNHVITKQDIDLAWDEERQEWEGQEGSRFWKMAPGWPHVKEGDIAYGKTYARKWEYDDEPFGYVVTVAPVEIQVFDKPNGTKGIAWMFPRVRNFKPKGSSVGRLDKILEAFGFDPKLEEKILPFHSVTKQAEEEEGVVLTHEEQRKLEQELYGDPYLVRQPMPRNDEPAAFPWVLMRHVRGIWSRKQREALNKLLEELKQTRNEDLLKKINKEFEPWYFAGKDFHKYLERIFRAGEEEGDVPKVIEAELQKGIPLDFEFDRIYSRGNAHHDLRFLSPEGRWLFGWTSDTPSVVLQKLNGDLVFPLRDKLLEHEEGDNVVCQRKAAQPVSWLDVVSPERLVLEVEPGEVGATKETGGEFHFVASGVYVMGVSKTDAHEYFIFPKKVAPWFDKPEAIAGRWVFRMIQGDFKNLPRSVWIANKPFREKGQLPYVLTHKLAEEEEKAKRENVHMFWNGEATIASLRLLGYPLPKDAEETLATNMAKARIPMPVTFEEWGKKEGFFYVELFDFGQIDPKTFLVLPFAGREQAWEVTAEFKSLVPDPARPGKMLEKTVIGFLFDSRAWTREQVEEFLQDMKLKPGSKDGEWRLIEKRDWNTTMRILKAEKRLVTGVVLEPYEVDAQEDFLYPEDIEEAMISFMRDYGNRGVMHKEYYHNLRIIENWIVREDYSENGVSIKRGTWMMTMWVGDDEVWDRIKAGQLTGFSIKGTGKRIWSPEVPLRKEVV